MKRTTPTNQGAVRDREDSMDEKRGLYTDGPPTGKIEVEGESSVS